MRLEAIQKVRDAVDIPVMLAPMFLISNPKMVINACASGIIGTFPALNARTDDILEDWMKEITQEIDRLKQENPSKKIGPWGINYIVHKSNKRYTEDLKLIERYQPPVVITSLGDPSVVTKIVHEYGGVVFSDVINIKFAKKAIEKGTDGLVLVANGAGGHGGTYNPIPFVREVREFFDGPIALAGGLTEGEDILITELLGADYAYIGTKFITSEESQAQDDYKKMILDGTIEDITYTDAFSGVKANYLTPSIVNAGLDPNNLKKKDKIDFSELREGSVKAWKDIYGAGQGVGSIERIQTISEIVEELRKSYQQAVSNIAEKERRIIQNN
ncbi:NAD(P)H-dependent flavin oxidoreductase [Oceanobacillus salinisoli]|uniref:NAD(P)H-dependent flavin oxidoreductase n=1 Tax=Oceanobacillus salinisoli TaxID=2678611 RepID=UPI0012E0D236|nr:nitronate monooxygenase [Oceanobacillus salinisoli]